MSKTKQWQNSRNNPSPTLKIEPLYYNTHHPFSSKQKSSALQSYQTHNLSIKSNPHLSQKENQMMKSKSENIFQKLTTNLNEEDEMDLTGYRSGQTYDRYKNLSSPIEKHCQGFNANHQKFKGYNLNLDTQLNEPYKFFQDEMHKTKLNFANNKLTPIKNKDKEAKDTPSVKTIYTKDQIYKYNKYTENCKEDFVINYKNLSKINDEYKFLKEKPDYNTVYLNNCKKLQMTPSTHGLFRKDKSKERLEGIIGGKRLLSLLETYKMMSENEYPEHIDLSNNNLRHEGLIEFIKTFQYKVNYLNMSGNNLSFPGATFLASHFEENPMQIEYLNLEGNNIGDRAGKELLISLINLRNLKHLVLSRNELSTQSGQALVDFLDQESKVTKLELHYNVFNGVDILPLVTNLNNYPITLLDLSWNKIGSHPETIRMLGEVLSSNTTLYHLDLSQNSILYEDMQSFVDYIKMNHTICGLHLTGNQGIVDGNGYVKPIKPYTDSIKNANTLAKSQSCNLLRTAEVLNKVTINSIVSCWICEEWVPVDFHLAGSVKGKKIVANITADEFVKGKQLRLIYQQKKIEDPVFIHFEFDNWKPWYIEESSGVWNTNIMCPPGTWKFFFTTGMSDAIVSNKHDLVEYKTQPMPLNVVFDPIRADMTSRDFVITEYNRIYIPEKVYKIADYKTNVIKPRTHPIWEYTDAKMKWSIPVSIWAKWIKDETELNIKCFENDWEILQEKMPKALKEDDLERAKLKSFLKPNHKLIRYLFKWYASIYRVGLTWGIGEQMFLDVFNSMNFFDEFFKTELPPIIFRETVTSDKNPFGPLSPPNACVRHQFMSFIIKSAARKYKLEPKVNISWTEANKLFVENYYTYMDSFDPNKWRWDRYYNEPVDIYFKQMDKYMELLFNKYMTTKPGEKPFFIVDSLIGLINDLDLTNYLNPDFIGRYFNLSMSIQVDETKSENHIKMRNKLEFFETYSRMADDLKLVYPSDSVSVRYPSESYETLNLGQKLWCIAPNLIKLFIKQASKVDIKNADEMKAIVNKIGVVTLS